MTRVLVTGGSGHIGRHVLSELTSRGYSVLALTSRLAHRQQEYPHVQWQQMDFNRTLNFAPFVRGCDAVLHLAAELSTAERMPRLNAEATRALAIASEDAGVKVFCYTSSVAVYGSSLKRLVTEDSPVLTSEQDIASEYWQDADMRCYGRTKLQGEYAIRDVAKAGHYVILRPSMVVDIPDLIDIGDWSTLRKSLAYHRHSHFIYVRDVADAILWFMERGLQNPTPGVSVFNLADDDQPDPSLGSLFNEFYRATGDHRYRVVPSPWQLDHLRAMISYRKLPMRHTFGRMLFSTDKLQRAGYKPRFGMSHAIAEALDVIKHRGRDEPQTRAP